MGSTALQLDRVDKKYGSVAAVRDLSLSVESGEMFGLIGPDGAGKTTTIRLLCGLLASDGGTVRVLGRDPVREHRHVTQSVGYLSQRFSLYGDLSVDENIAFFADIHGLSLRKPQIRDRRDHLLDLTQLTPFRDRLADRLSGGMKQKLALICTLIHEPAIIILDEPTTGVDPVSRREFWVLLSGLLAHGITILMATPYLDEAERCSRVALLHEGSLIALDTPESLRSGLPGIVSEILVEDRERATALLRKLPGVTDVQQFGERVHVRLDDRSPLADAARMTAALKDAGLAVQSVRRVPASLEDVFIASIEREKPRAARGIGAPASDAARSGARGPRDKEEKETT